MLWGCIGEMIPAFPGGSPYTQRGQFIVTPPPPRMTSKVREHEPQALGAGPAGPVVSEESTEWMV